jgi:hypothetical protein
MSTQKANSTAVKSNESIKVLGIAVVSIMTHPQSPSVPSDHEESQQQPSTTEAQPVEQIQNQAQTERQHGSERTRYNHSTHRIG